MDPAMIISIELKDLAGKHDSVEDMFRAVIPKARNHWAVLDENEQFKGAIGAVILALIEQEKDEDKERVTTEMNMLNAMSAATRPGVSLNLEAIVKEDFKPIGLLKIWRELAKEETPCRDEG